MNEASEWFIQCISDGLKGLAALRLDGTPAADTIIMTREVWVKVLWTTKQWDQCLDQARIHTGFIAMMAQVDRWPAPKSLLLYMPPREKPLAVAAPEISEAQRQKNLQRLKDIINSV